ncbi:MAG: hypothetical protein R3D29_15210 [Nitratireductor sp.]
MTEKASRLMCAPGHSWTSIARIATGAKLQPCSGLFLTFGESRTGRDQDLANPVAAGRGAGDNAFDIVPGKPEESILLNRVASVEPGVMMPELGRNLPDMEAVALLRAWILSLR